MRRLFLTLFLLPVGLILGSESRSAGLSQSQVDEFSNLPSAQFCRRLHFESVDIVPGFINDTWFATVVGKKPWITIEVHLVPLIYTRRPEYWGIEVIGCSRGIGLPQEASYQVTIGLNGILGTKGIEIIGAGKPEKHAVPPK